MMKKIYIIFYYEGGISQLKILKILKGPRCTVQEIIKERLKLAISKTERRVENQQNYPKVIANILR